MSDTVFCTTCRRTVPATEAEEYGAPGTGTCHSCERIWQIRRPLTTEEADRNRVTLEARASQRDWI